MLARSLILSASVLLAACGQRFPPSDRSGPGLPPGGGDILAGLPASFIENRGQARPRAEYYLPGPGTSVALTRTGVALGLESRGGDRWGLVLEWDGAPVSPEGVGRALTSVNYLKGEPGDWLTRVPAYRRVAYRNLWHGIDLVVRGTPGALKYAFRVAPGADPRDIRLSWRGAISVELRDGALRVMTPAGEVTDHPPFSYQPSRDGRTVLRASYRLDPEGAFGFRVGPYDPSLPLVIDPEVTLLYSTFLGGSSSDEASAIAVDRSGAVYVTGSTEDAATDLPTTPGAFETSHNGDRDAFVAKITPSGDALAYSTFLGGSGTDTGTGIAVDPSGATHLTGVTQDAATDLPTTPGAFDTSHNGDRDAFVAKITPSGDALAYSTFLGGSGIDTGTGIAVDPSGAAHLIGISFDAAADLPTTPGAFDSSHNGVWDAFVAALTPSGDALSYSTFLGGSGTDFGNGIAVDAAGAAYVTGRTDDAATDLPTTPGAFDTSHNGDSDAFVAKITPSGDALAYSTFLGGSGIDLGTGIAVDPSGVAVVAGGTLDAATDIPTTPGAFDPTHSGGFDAFVSKLTLAGDGLTYSTFLGGSDDDDALGIALDPSGAAHLTGSTAATDFPTTPGAFDPTQNGDADAFVARLSPGGDILAYSTFLGGSAFDSGNGIAADVSGAAYVAGRTDDDATDLPTTPGALDPTHNGFEDAFVAGFTTPYECRGVAATLVGSEGTDPSLGGTPGADVIQGFGGDDRIHAGGGNDLVCGGEGRDRVNLGGGSDRARGDQGNDRLNGSGGNDRLFGDSGKDRLKGGGGKDRLKGGKGKGDSCNGGGGRDRAACERERNVP